MFPTLSPSSPLTFQILIQYIKRGWVRYLGDIYICTCDSGNAEIHVHRLSHGRNGAGEIKVTIMMMLVVDVMILMRMATVI